jgi:hypothetical protein
MPVSHGSRHQNRVSSIPIAAGTRRPHRPSSRTATTRIAVQAVDHDTENSRATDAVERSFPARPINSRHRPVVRRRAAISSVCWVNVRRSHQSARHRNERFTTVNTTTRPACGTSQTTSSRTAFTAAENSPHAGHGADVAVAITFTVKLFSVSSAATTVYSCSPVKTRVSASKDVGSFCIWGLPAGGVRITSLEDPRPSNRDHCRVNREDPVIIATQFADTAMGLCSNDSLKANTIINLEIRPAIPGTRLNGSPPSPDVLGD